MIIFFTYFYVSITFNPTEVAENMKKYGGFVPGIRPGKPTADYLDFILSRITLPGALYLGLISVLPNFFFIWLNQTQYQNFPFGGTAVLIMVGVALETVKQIESQLMQRNYEGFLR
jgi:preprotein translocase subunit SecY